MQKKPKVKHISISKLKKKVWTLFSLYVRNRDNWTCYTCGHYEKGFQMHAGHFITRNRSATIFDPMNVHAQCIRCNFWGNGNVGIYAQNLIRDYGKEAFDDLVARSKTIHPLTVLELNSLMEKYGTR